jgi:hypothetical protein
MRSACLLRARAASDVVPGALLQSGRRTFRVGAKRFCARNRRGAAAARPWHSSLQSARIPVSPRSTSLGPPRIVEAQRPRAPVMDTPRKEGGLCARGLAVVRRVAAARESPICQGSVAPACIDATLLAFFSSGVAPELHPTSRLAFCFFPHRRTAASSLLKLASRHHRLVAHP